jgi:translocation and assembly module TamB
VEADDRIFIRGRGLESEWAANVNAVTGREAPLILGSLTLRRGWLDFSGRRFNLTRGSVDFDRNAPNDPRLDIRAELSNADVTAAIVVSGRASDPDIELTSTPSLPSEDVMALVLFGKPAQDLTPFESLQTAEALASLSGIGPFGGEGVTGRLRRTVGLDLLNVDLDPETGGSLTVGKYVTKGIFVSASQDAQGRNGSVTVKYEVTDNIVIETELEQTGDQTVSANWKKDF